MSPTFRLILFICLFSVSRISFSENKEQDHHYTDKGFFDIHVCNWPNKPLFLMGLFSTTDFNDISSVEIYTPDNISIGSLDLNKFRQFKNKKNQLKKAFINQFNLPKKTTDGWYKATITLKNNKVIHAKDFVQHETMPLPVGTSPSNKSENIKLPSSLHWDKIKSAKFYKIYIKDLWLDGKLIYESKLLTDNMLVLPKNLIKNGGYYSWAIHARDINEDIKLGDFNHGSLSHKMTFSVED